MLRFGLMLQFVKNASSTSKAVRKVLRTRKEQFSIWNSNCWASKRNWEEIKSLLLRLNTHEWDLFRFCGDLLHGFKWPMKVWIKQWITRDQCTNRWFGSGCLGFCQLAKVHWYNIMIWSYENKVKLNQTIFETPPHPPPLARFPCFKFISPWIGATCSSKTGHAGGIYYSKDY